MSRFKIIFAFTPIKTSSWYSAAASSTVTGKAGTSISDVATAKGSFSTGGFEITITPVKGSNYNKLAFVDAAGKTKYILDASDATKLTQDIDPTTVGLVANDSGSFTIVIDYRGTALTTEQEIQDAWNALGKTKVSWKITLTGTGGVLGAKNSNAYDGSLTELTYSNVSLGTVDFNTSGHAEITNSEGFVYAALGQALVQDSGVSVTIAVTENTIFVD